MTIKEIDEYTNKTKIEKLIKQTSFMKKLTIVVLFYLGAQLIAIAGAVTCYNYNKESITILNYIILSAIISVLIIIIINIIINTQEKLFKLSYAMMLIIFISNGIVGFLWGYYTYQNKI